MATTLYLPNGGSISVADDAVSRYLSSGFGFSTTPYPAPDHGGGGGGSDGSSLDVKNSSGDSLVQVVPYDDGTGSDLYLKAPSTSNQIDAAVDSSSAYIDVTGAGQVELESTSTYSKVEIAAAPGQTDNLLDVKNSDGKSLIYVTPSASDGEITGVDLYIDSPQGRGYLDLYANDGWAQLFYRIKDSEDPNASYWVDSGASASGGYSSAGHTISLEKSLRSAVGAGSEQAYLEITYDHSTNGQGDTEARVFVNTKETETSLVMGVIPNVQEYAWPPASGTVQAGASTTAASIGVTAATGQTDPLLDLRDSTGATKYRVTPDGHVTPFASPFTVTQTPDPLDDGNPDIDVLNTATDAGVALATQVAGDTYPRTLLMADATDGLYMGDGTFNPWSDGPSIFYGGTRTGSRPYFISNEIEIQNGGVVLKAPNGTKYRLKVANDGTLSTEAA